MNEVGVMQGQGEEYINDEGIAHEGQYQVKKV